ncbi:hypothetical protein HYQ45_015191 [Verticillium longisporum]|uniref:Uncharacterized protein n=1 Tax=Verticillium longisporum TaxID=100787 RepID=A0A0G4KLJ9_VERLO|nr:hypothetical protein HYQ45_015191 [Verticillium longisporum]CRK09738.1 hypothetical protein BN1708_002261 [Verticillium longisporum]
MASQTSHDFPLATENYYNGDGASGQENSGAADHAVDSEAGASGDSPGAISISEEALIAIIVVVSIIAALGIGMAVLFYVAKKREWKIRENLRRSARKVVTALTPRRTEFPKEVKDSLGRSRRGRTKLDDVPPTPRLRPEDLEKGMAIELQLKDKKKWGRK